MLLVGTETSKEVHFDSAIFLSMQYPLVVLFSLLLAFVALSEGTMQKTPIYFSVVQVNECPCPVYLVCPNLPHVVVTHRAVSFCFSICKV